MNDATVPSPARRYSASNDGTAKVWDAATSKAIAILAHDDPITYASFSPDGTRVVTASEDKTAKGWDAATGKAIAILAHDYPITYASFSPDGTRVVAVSENTTAKVWDAATGKAIAADEIPPEHYETLAESLSRQRLSEDGDLRPLDDSQRAEVQARLMKLAATTSAKGKLARWLLATGPDARLTPIDSTTRRDRVEALLANGTEVEIREANALWPTHPLIQIALAAHERAPNAGGQPDAVRKAAEDAAAIRADFLREYGVKRLPDDAAICTRAAEVLAAQKDFSRALQAADRALALDAKNSSALETRLTALGKLGREAEAAELRKQHPDLKPSPDK